MHYDLDCQRDLNVNLNLGKYVIPRSSILGLNYKKIPDAKHAFEHMLDWIMADIIDVISL